MKYFGTDGFRGEANVNLNVVHAYKVGRFLGWYYGQDYHWKGHTPFQLYV
jgi:phosphoglucosamine mutase